MIVEDIRVDGWEGSCELSARIRATSLADDGERVWYRMPAELEPAEADGSPFLPPLLQACMALGEPLTIDGPVSPRLLAGAERAQKVYAGMYTVLRPVAVEAAEALESAVAGTEAAGFFTRGADSWYTALTGRSAEVPITTLVYAPQADYFAGQPKAAVARKLRSEATRLTREAAEHAGFAFVEMRSNVRQLVEPVRDWSRSNGGLLAGMGLAMSARFARVHIPSTLERGNLVPLGSRPDLDPLFSTEATEIVHDGAELTRMEKLRFLAGRPEALASLKVCINQTADRNCGRCGKCVRTMIGLRLAGAPQALARFDQPLTLRRVSESPPLDPLAWAFHREVTEAVERAGDRRLAAALRVAALRGLVFASPLNPKNRGERAELAAQARLRR